MKGGYSLRMKLNDVIWNIEYEQQVMENLRYCNKLNGNKFEIIFWYDNLSKKEIKDFVKRNENILLEINVDITKSHKTDAWFVINSSEEKNYWRYKYDGGILDGIVEYIKIIKHIKGKGGSWK